jgi:predicted TIM-barrel fold metal-dependent hydrolase
VTPQDANAGAKELERAVKTLGLKGAVINSHTRGEFLDDEKFWDIFAAAEALDVPIYIHPSGPPPSMSKPFLERGLEGAIFGFGVEVALHVLRIIVSGAFDRFPRLKIVIGHTGEGLPFWLYRIDYMHTASVKSGRYTTMKPLKRKPSDYMRENLYITNSGVAWDPSVRFCQQVLGVDRVLYAMDYPYQFEKKITIQRQPAMSDLDKKKFFQTNAEKLFNALKQLGREAFGPRMQVGYAFSPIMMVGLWCCRPGNGGQSRRRTTTARRSRPWTREETVSHRPPCHRHPSRTCSSDAWRCDICVRAHLISSLLH